MDRLLSEDKYIAADTIQKKIIYMLANIPFKITTHFTKIETMECMCDVYFDENSNLYVLETTSYFTYRITSPRTKKTIRIMLQIIPKLSPKTPSAFLFFIL